MAFDVTEIFEDMGPICGRCCDSKVELYPANCKEKPENTHGPIGMYHCPDCGTMVLAGFEHPWLCKLCLERKHPAFD
jgi:rubrerythrin